MQSTVALMELQKRIEQLRIYTEVRKSSQSMVYELVLYCVEEGGGLVQLIWIVC